MNAYGDYDQGYGTGDWYQVGAGFESLGKYLDFRLNGYLVVGDDSTLLSSNLSNTLRLMGNSAFKVRSEVLDNAYSGIQAEVGGPLPVLGQYGLNMYVGGYYLQNGQWPRYAGLSGSLAGTGHRKPACEHVSDD